jgi:16S rRNA processing protein RimM
MPAEDNRRILLGRIAGAHGIRGEVLIRSFAEPPENVAAYGPLSDEAGGRSFAIESVRPGPKGLIGRIAGIGDRSAAEALQGTDLYVERGRLPVPAEGEFYHADLVGLAAVDAEGRAVGEITAVQNFGAGDLLEVRLAGSTRAELVPFTEACVPQIDFAARRALVIMPSAAEASAADEEE